jgi:hypothetical protein
MLAATTASASNAYASATPGRTVPANLATLRTPPKSTGAASTAKASVVQPIGMPWDDFRTPLIAFVSTMLNAVENVIINNTANKTPPTRECRPRWM